MSYRVVFTPNTAGYRLHAATCANAVNKDGPFTKNPQYLCKPVFDTPESARRWADEDESDKAGCAVRANWRVCACAK